MFKNIPSHWDIKKICQICNVKGGKRLPQNHSLVDYKTEHPYLRVTDFKNFSIEDSELKYIEDNTHHLIKNYIINKQDLYISIAGTIGLVGEIPTNLDGANLTENAAKLIIIDKNINKNYLKYCLNSSYIQKIIKELTVGVGVPKLSLSRINEISIPIPPTLEEQEEIVDILDNAANMVRLRNECIDHTEDLIPAIFYEMFGDIVNNQKKSPIHKINEYVKINPTKQQFGDKDKFATFLAMKDVSENGQIISDEDRPIKEVIKGFTCFQENDVLLAKITPCFENGKGTIARNLTNKIGFGSTEFHVLRPINNEEILPEYLFYLLRTDNFKTLGKMNMKGAAGQKRVPKDFIENYKFPKPSIEAQKEFAQIVKDIDEYKKQQYQELKYAKDLFNSLLQKTFTGELTANIYGK